MNMERISPAETAIGQAIVALEKRNEKRTQELHPIDKEKRAALFKLLDKYQTKIFKHIAEDITTYNDRRRSFAFAHLPEIMDECAQIFAVPTYQGGRPPAPGTLNGQWLEEWLFAKDVRHHFTAEVIPTATTS